MQILCMCVLVQPHLLCQEMVEEANPRLLPLVQPVHPVSDLYYQLLGEIVEPELRLQCV